MKDTKNELITLFDEARSSNEFEFVMTLLNYKSIGSPAVQANLHEWFEALLSYERYYNTFTDKEKTRAAAQLYSTFFENSDFYNIIGSLCRIKLGFRSSSFLFWKTKKHERLLGIGEKEDFLIDLLNDTGKQHIISFFRENHYTEIRNTFFHSAYSLSGNQYIMHDSGDITINGTRVSSFDVVGFFYPMVDKIIIFFKTFRQLYLDHFASYQQDKAIGPNPFGPIGIIIGTPQGLGGIMARKAVSFFGIPVDVGIWYDQALGIFAAHNMRIDFPSIEQIEIGQQIKRYEAKSRLLKNDAAFSNLIDKVVERNVESEIVSVINLLLKFAEAKSDEMDKETNPYKKKSLPKGIIPLYRKALELGTGRPDMAPIEARIKELEVFMETV